MRLRHQKARKKGKEYGGESKIQVMYENTLVNGEKRTEVETLTVSDLTPTKARKSLLCVFLWLLMCIKEKRI